MSYREVLRIFKLERDLSDNETAFLNTLRQMSEGERELLAETLGPPVKSKSTKPATKRVIEKCAHFVDGETCGLTRRAMIHQVPTAAGFHEFEQSLQSSSSSSKSKRASSLAGAIKKTDKEPRCVVCHEIRDHAEHDVANGGHEFTTDLAKRMNEVLDRHNLDGGVHRMRCTMENCGAYADDNIHHLTTHPTYHEFVGGETAVGAGGD